MKLPAIIDILAYTPEDQAQVEIILKDLRKQKMVASSEYILQLNFFTKIIKKFINTFGLGTNLGELSKGLY